MCFRPSALNKNDGGQKVTCQTCGMQVEADPGSTGGICPYCGDPIPVDPPDDFSEIDPGSNVRIL